MIFGFTANEGEEIDINDLYVCDYCKPSQLIRTEKCPKCGKEMHDRNKHLMFASIRNKK